MKQITHFFMEGDSPTSNITNETHCEKCAMFFKVNYFNHFTRLSDIENRVRRLLEGGTQKREALASNLKKLFT